MDRCPICNSELFYKYGKGSIEEHRQECSGCGRYSETFAYGSTEIAIGDFTTGWYYTDTLEHCEAIRKRIIEVGALYKTEVGS